MTWQGNVNGSVLKAFVKSHLRSFHVQRTMYYISPDRADIYCMARTSIMRIRQFAETTGWDASATADHCDAEEVLECLTAPRSVCVQRTRWSAGLWK